MMCWIEKSAKLEMLLETTADSEMGEVASEKNLIPKVDPLSDLGHGKSLLQSH